METKTIEERAKSIYAFNCEEDDFGYCERQEAKESGYIRGAKEQDCIARAEQRKIDREEFTTKLKNACLTVETKYNMNTFGFLYDRILEAMKGE